jgi:hypothetical protein
MKPPATLRYSFVKSGSMEEGFDDKVAIKLSARPDGKCCAAAAEFLGGPRKLSLPEVEEAEGNPVVLYFLERDIREMSRLTKGQANYSATHPHGRLPGRAQIKDVSLPLPRQDGGGARDQHQAYLDDPLRARFEARQQAVRLHAVRCRARRRTPCARASPPYGRPRR